MFRGNSSSKGVPENTVRRTENRFQEAKATVMEHIKDALQSFKELGIKALLSCVGASILLSGISFSTAVFSLSFTEAFSRSYGASATTLIKNKALVPGEESSSGKDPMTGVDKYGISMTAEALYPQISVFPSPIVLLFPLTTAFYRHS